MKVFSNIRLQKEAGKITEDEMYEKMKQVVLDDDSRVNLLGEMFMIVEKLAISLGNDFYQEFKNYTDATFTQLKYYRDSPTYTLEELEKIDLRVNESAAKIHSILKEKLISIRDETS